MDLNNVRSDRLKLSHLSSIGLHLASSIQVNRLSFLEAPLSIGLHLSYQFDLNRISQSQQQQQSGNVTYQEQPRVLQLEQTQQFVNLPRANDYYAQMNDQLLQQQIVEYYQRLMQ